MVDNPLNYIDPSGKAGAPTTPTPDGTLTISVLDPAHAIGNCGKSSFDVQWNVSGLVSGYVLQHIKESAYVTDCQGIPVLSPHNPSGTDFTEAWSISGSSNTKKDTWASSDEGNGRQGTISIVAKVKFIKDYSLTVPPWGYDLPGTDAHGLPVIKPTPKDWTDDGTQTHSITIKFDCCCKYKHIKQTPPIVTSSP